MHEITPAEIGLFVAQTTGLVTYIACIFQRRAAPWVEPFALGLIWAIALARILEILAKVFI